MASKVAGGRRWPARLRTVGLAVLALAAVAVALAVVERRGGRGAGFEFHREPDKSDEHKTIAGPQRGRDDDPLRKRLDERTDEASGKARGAEAGER